MKSSAQGAPTFNRDFLTNGNLQYLPSDQVVATGMPLTAEELRASLNSLNGSTDPRPDGHTVPFHTMFWEELRPLIFSAASQLYGRSLIPRQVRSSITILIPKKNKYAGAVQSSRPISLLNVMFKIIAKDQQ